jgi:hypothetical protein
MCPVGASNKSSHSVGSETDAATGRERASTRDIVEEGLCESHHSFGRETDTASGRERASTREEDRKNSVERALRSRHSVGGEIFTVLGRE